GHPSRRLEDDPDQDRRLEFQLAGDVRLHEPARATEGNADRYAGPLRQLSQEPEQPEFPADRRPLGRAGDRRVVHRVPASYPPRRAPEQQPPRPVVAPRRFRGRREQPRRTPPPVPRPKETGGPLTPTPSGLNHSTKARRGGFQTRPLLFHS